MEGAKKEELIPMEIRVTVELPKDVYDEYNDLKRKRKLTNRVEQAIQVYENGDHSKNNEIDSSKVERLEDAILQMSNMVNKLVEHSINDREERKDFFNTIKQQVENQSLLVENLSKEVEILKKSSLDNTTLISNNLETSNHLIISNNKISSTEDVKSTEPIQSVQAIHNVISVEETEEELLNKLAALRMGKDITVEVEVERKPPSKSVRKKLSSMMDI